MTEPVSTTIGGFAAWKAFGMTIVVAICVMAVAAVVLMMRMPRSPREWGVGLITTVISSLAGGSFIIIKFNLHAWATDVWGMIALGGFFFTCGLPGGLLSVGFSTISKRRRIPTFSKLQLILKTT